MTTLNRYKQNLHLDGNKVISYTTHVATIDRANNQLLRLGYWSMTTSKHINYVASEFNLSIVDKKADEPKKENNSLNLMSAFLALGNLTDNKDTLESKVKYKERIIFATMRANILEWQIPDYYKNLKTDKERLEVLQKIESI